MKNLRALLISERLLFGSSEWKKNKDKDYVLETEIGTYNYSPRESGMLFEPSKPFWDVLKNEEVPMGSLEEAKRFQEEHYAKNKGTAPFVHPEIENLREVIEKVSAAMKAAFKRKPNVEEIMRPNYTTLSINLDLVKHPMSEGPVQDIIDLLSKKLGVPLKTSGRIKERTSPDPVEGTVKAVAKIGKTKIDFEIQSMRGKIFGIYAVVEGS